MEDAYAVLGVRTDATNAEIRYAYLSLIRQHHPDRSHTDSLHATRIIAAYETLSQPGKRAEYDSRLAVEQNKYAAPRVADVVDLDAFDVHGGPPLTFVYPCRCGQQYSIDAETISCGVNHVQCTGCSEVIRIQT